MFVALRRVRGAVVLAVALVGLGCSREEADSSLEARVRELEAGLAGAQTTIAALQTRVATAEERLTQVSANEALALGAYLSVEEGAMPRAVFSGINVQLVNGTGRSERANGLGNLIIGYNYPEPAVPVGGDEHCSLGTDASGVPILDEASCLAANGSWGAIQRTGSHYLVMGSYNDYTAWGGIVTGTGNIANGHGASVIGGGDNHASGWFAAVSGGSGNAARGTFATVAGGSNGLASGDSSTVTGGAGNVASGAAATVTGGRSGTASGTSSVVVGGTLATASGDWSVVLGGRLQTAAAQFETVPATP